MGCNVFRRLWKRNIVTQNQIKAMEQHLLSCGDCRTVTSDPKPPPPPRRPWPWNRFERGLRFNKGIQGEGGIT